MPENPQTTLQPPRAPILSQAEAARRMALLADLQAALAAADIRSVLAGNHRLVLRSGPAPCERSGPTDPRLHIFTAATPAIATVDGATYSVAGCRACPVGDLRTAVIVIQQLAGFPGAKGPGPEASGEVTR